MFRLHGFALLFGAIILTLGEPASAGSFNVSPVRVQIPPNGRPEVVRIRNLSDQDVVIQVDARSWLGDVDGASKADLILAVPPVARLPAAGEQIIRLAVRHPVQIRSEQAFRLVVTEVPLQVRDDPNALAFALRMVIPLFVTPAHSSASPNWKLQKQPTGEFELEVSNSGTSHLRVGELEVAGNLVGEGATYVLAGESKSWPLGKKLSELPEVVEVRAETNHGPLVAQVRPGG